MGIYKKLKNYFYTGVIFLAAPFLLTKEAFAVSSTIEAGLEATREKSTLKKVDAISFGGDILRTILGLMGIFALLIVVYAGFLYLTASGSSDQVQRAHKMLLWGVIGLAIIFSAFTISTFVIEQLSSSALG